MNFATPTRTAFFATPRNVCPHPSRRGQPAVDATATVDASSRDAIDQAVDLLDPVSTMRLTELLTAVAILQVPRHYFPDAEGVEELCLILPAPGSLVKSVFAIAVASDDTVRLGSAGLPEDSLKAVRAQAHSQCDGLGEGDALQSAMEEHGAHLFASLSACAEVSLWSCPNSRAPAPTSAIAALDDVLSRTWLAAGDSWFGGLGADDLALLQYHGLAADLLCSELRDCMKARCAGALDHLDYFEAGVNQDSILTMWRKFLMAGPDCDFVPSLSAYNYLVSQDVVVAASRVPVWDDPLFMTRVNSFVRYQRAAEALRSPPRLCP
ncbi:MAG: hypothetical protein H7232_01990 [Aeromicrobium sp.]|nr:hypothetical protein [Burkholderiales bacterium]